MTPKVLDLSHHNDGPHGGDIDFGAIAAFGVEGVILKASQGTRNVDPTYAKRSIAAAAAGLLVGAYHFADASTPKDQVDHFLSVVTPGNNTLVALDYEPNPGNEMALAQARDFLMIVEATLGRKAVLYSGNLIKQELGDRPDAFFGSHRLWLAHYNDHPRWPKAWAAPWLHQFSGDGTNNHGIVVPGVNTAQASKLDMNAFAGTDAELTAQWAL